MKIYLILIATLLQPFINSVTGLGIRYNFSTYFGPLFYTFLAFVFLIINTTKKSVFSFAVFFLAFLLFALHFVLDKSNISDFGSYLKVIFPFLVFDFIRGLRLSDRQWLKLLSVIKMSIIIYTLSVIISFLMGYQIQAGKGYFGLIFAGNELIVLLLLIVAINFFLSQYSVAFPLPLVLISFFLTLSKSIILLAPVFIFNGLRRSSVISIIYILLVGVGLVAFFVGFLMPVISLYLTDTNSISSVFYYNEIDLILNIITFGRYDYVLDAIRAGAVDDYRWVLGNGVSGADFYTLGKGGTELDIFDSISYYGLVGLSFLFLFYYFPVLFSKRVNIRCKISFFVVIIYSILGGHFYSSPLVGFYYGIFLGLLFNNNFFIFLRNINVK